MKMKTSNTMKIKQEDGSFEDVKISYIEPNYCTAEGQDTIVLGRAAHAEGYKTVAIGNISHAEGNVSSDNIFISGEANTKTYTLNSQESSTLTIGIGDIIKYNDQFAVITNREDHIITVDKTLSSVALNNTLAVIWRGAAYGHVSHSEGSSTNAYGVYSHTEGYQTVAGSSAHAEGTSTMAYGSSSHTEGNITRTTGVASHAEGNYTRALEDYSHAEGDHTIASGVASHAEGLRTTASGDYSHVQGRYNIEDIDNTYAFIIGNGSSITRSNALAVKWNGDVVIKNNTLPLSPVYSGYVIAKSIGEVPANNSTNVTIEFPAEFFYDGNQPIVTPSLVHTEPAYTPYLSVTVPDRRIVDGIGTATIRILNTSSIGLNPGLQYTVTPCLNIK